MTYGAVGAVRVGHLHGRGGHSDVRACGRCGIVRKVRAGQAWCFDCTLVERPITRKTRKLLRETEEQDNEAFLRHGLSA